MPQSSSNYQSPFTSGLNRHKPTFPLQAPSSHDQRAFPPSSRLPPSNKQVEKTTHTSCRTCFVKT
ncbi:hypothetical protein V6Z12_D06G150000 [Gossypium hirsutum]